MSVVGEEQRGNTLEMLLKFLYLFLLWQVFCGIGEKRHVSSIGVRQLLQEQAGNENKDLTPSGVDFSSPLTHSEHRSPPGYLKVHRLKKDLFKPTGVKWSLFL